MMLQNTKTPRDRSRLTRPGWQALRCGLGLLAAAALLGLACSDDDEGDGGVCIGGDGAVAGAPDTHCIAADGSEIAQAIGMCASGGEAAEVGEAAEEEEHEHEAGEEAHAILTGREGDDDDCKYRVRFENTCVALNEPVTFTLALTRKLDGEPGAGAIPRYPEVFFADDPTHVSPSANIDASEGPAGTYEIGPIVFNRSGRWVVRFHYFETCSDLPPDSPHGHVAFYIDVP